MSTLPTPLPNQQGTDTDQLKMVAIFWYILAGLQALTGCIALALVSPMILAGLGVASSGHADDATAGFAISGLFGCFGFFLLAVWWGLALLDFTVARSLPKRRKRTLCMIMAVWACFVFPLGTILGVFTLMLLSRPSVKASFT